MWRRQLYQWARHSRLLAKRSIYLSRLASIAIIFLVVAPPAALAQASIAGVVASIRLLPFRRLDLLPFGRQHAIARDTDAGDLFR
jgi:hypothetical protein